MYLLKYLFWRDTILKLIPYLLPLFINHKFLTYDIFILIIISSTFFKITDVLVFRSFYHENHFIAVFMHRTLLVIEKILGHKTFLSNLCRIFFFKLCHFLILLKQCLNRRNSASSFSSLNLDTDFWYVSLSLQFTNFIKI